MLNIFTKLSKSILVLIFLFAFTFGNTYTSTAQGDLGYDTGSGVVDVSGAAPSVTPTELCKSSTDIGCRIAESLLTSTLNIFAGFAAFTIKGFDSALDGYVLNLQTLFLECADDTDNCSSTDKSGDTRLYNAWSLFRNIANIIVFFSVIFAVWKYMIGSSGSESTDLKRSLIKFILYLLLVNFSFPLSKFFIDIANYFTLYIYGSIVGFDGGMTKESLFTFSGSLTKVILESMGLNFLASLVGSSSSAIAFPGFSSWSVLGLAILYMIVAFFAFLYASLVVLIRAFILILCVASSPLMFLSMGSEFAKNLTEKWRNYYISNILFAPLLMIGFWFSINFLKESVKVVSYGSGDAFATGVGAAEQTGANAVNMILAIVALVATIKVAGIMADKAGVNIASKVTSFGKTAALGLATGGAGFLARGALGAAGSRLAQAKWVNNTSKESSIARRAAASIQSRVGNRLLDTKVAGKSAKTQNQETLEKGRAKFATENEEEIKRLGMKDMLNQARTPEDLKAFEEELVNRRNGKASRNFIYKHQEKESKIEDVKNKANNNIEDLKSGTLSGLKNSRAERLAKIEKLRNEKLNNIKDLAQLGAVSKAELDKAEAKNNRTQNKAKEFRKAKYAEKTLENKLSNQNDVLSQRIAGIESAKDQNLNEIEKDFSATNRSSLGDIAYGSGYVVGKSKDALQNTVLAPAKAVFNTGKSVADMFRKGKGTNLATAMRNAAKDTLEEGLIGLPAKTKERFSEQNKDNETSQ